MKATTPKAYPGDRIMVENYRTQDKRIEPAIVLETRTVWLSKKKADHKYIVRLCRKTSSGKSIKLDIQNHRIKSQNKM